MNGNAPKYACDRKGPPAEIIDESGNEPPSRHVQEGARILRRDQ
jgi:hypothetical protein